MEEYADGGTVLVNEENFFAAVDRRFVPANGLDTGVAEAPRVESAEQGLTFPAGDTGVEEEFHPALDEAEFDAALRNHAPEHFGDQGFREPPPMEKAEIQGAGHQAPEEGESGGNEVEDKGGGIEDEAGKLGDGGAEEWPSFEKGVERGSTGVGRPYAPAGWQWRVGSTSRVTASGHYSDVFRTPPNAKELSSMKQVESYMKDKLGLSETEVKDCLKTFEARIPATKEIVESEKGLPSEKETVPGDAQEEAVDNATEGLVISPQNVVYEEDEEEAEDEDEDEDEPNSVTLDEFLKTPENWPSIGWRLRGPEGKLQLKQLLSEARSRESTPEASLKRLKLRLLKFPAFLRSEELEILPNSLLALVALVMTEGVVYEAKSRKMLNGELVMIIRDELTKHQKAAGLDELGVELKSKEKKSKKVQTNETGPGRKRKSQAPLEEEAATKRKRKSVNDLPGKPEPFLVNRVVQLKPSLSGLSVEVDDDDPEEETVEQAVPRLMTPEAATDALNAALEAAAETLPGGASGSVQSPPPEAGPAFASPLFFADQKLSEEETRNDGLPPGYTHFTPPLSAEPRLPPAAPAAPPVKAPPMTIEQREIVVYRRKLVKLERKRKHWEQAFDQKLGAYKAKREGLGQQLEKRRADQEAQKIRVVQETERLREVRNTALQEMRALQVVGNLADTAEQELEKRGSWESIYTAAVDEVKKAKKKGWEEMKKGVGEVKRSNLDQMRKKTEAYKQLGMALPQSDIELEREQYNAEITEMQAKLEAQKVILDAEIADMEQKMTVAKAAYNEFKAQHKKLEKEETELQKLLQEPIRG